MVQTYALGLYSRSHLKGLGLRVQVLRFGPCPCHGDVRGRAVRDQQKEHDKAEVSISSGGTGARCVRPWLTRGIV